MKKIALLILCGFLTSGLMAQQPSNRVKVASQARMNSKAHFQVKLNQLKKDYRDLAFANKVAPIQDDNQQIGTAAAASAITPVQLGRAANAFSCLRTEQNQLFASNMLNTVAFIHRNDVTLYGGGGTQNGKFRYDLSTDGGLSFTTDIGPLQTLYSNYGRYPNIAGYIVDSASANPFDQRLAWASPTNKFPTPGWIGHAYGLTDVTTGTVSSTEQYLFDTDPTLLPGGLHHSANGIFWNVEFDANSDSLYLYKGVYNSTNDDVDWTRDQSWGPDHYTAANSGTPVAIGPNVASSPDGQDVWVVWLGDIAGGHDSLLSPCYYHSSDAGNTWDTAATEIDLRQFTWMSDSLTTFWVNIDSVTGDTTPAGSGRPTTGFDYDITVDADGNLHLAAIIGNGTVPGGDPPGYSIFSGINKFITDVYTTDGGTTWDASYIAPILTFRGEFGTPDPDDGSLLAMDNVVQASRTDDGTRIFYSWVDSDTAVIGFGESDNIAPNLRIASMRITDGYKSCYKLISDGDANWDGRVLFPAMSPTVLTAESGNRHYLPIAFLEMINNDQLAPCRWHYLGNDAQILESDYQMPSSLNLSWDGNGNCGIFVGSEPVLPTGVTLHPSYPNPARDEVAIRFELDQAQQATVEIHTLYGQKIMTVASGNHSAGSHEVRVNTSNLAHGVYLYTLKTADQSFTNKMVIVK